MKLQAIQSGWLVPMSRPLRARELKHYLDDYRLAQFVSRPLRARELKPTTGADASSIIVAPLAGA